MSRRDLGRASRALLLVALALSLYGAVAETSR